MMDQPYSQVDMLLKSPKVFLQPSDCISVLESLQITWHDEYQFEWSNHHSFMHIFCGD